MRIINCLNLTRDQHIYIMGLIAEESGIQKFITQKYMKQIDSLSLSYKNKSDSLKSVLNPEDYKKRMIELNRSFILEKNTIVQKLNKIIYSRNNELYYAISLNLNPNQKTIFEEWIKTGKVKCSPFKP